MKKTKHKHQYQLGRSKKVRVCACGAFKFTASGIREGGGAIKAEPSFNVSLADRGLIQSIRARAIIVLKDAEATGGPVYDALSIEMDLTACHANGTPLRLADLLAAKKFDFIHDVLGINRHIDRTTGKLGNCFLPRFVVRKGAH